MNDFYSFSQKGRALRLRQLAILALPHYDLNVKQIRLVTNHYNCIFRVDTLDGNKFILRVCLPYPKITEQLNAELDWLRAISHETDLTVPEPLATRDGAWMVAVQSAGVPEVRQCVVFKWLAGPDLSSNLTPKNVEAFGAFSAKLHQHGASYAPPHPNRLMRFDKGFYFDEPFILFDDDFQHMMPESRRAFFQSAIDRIQDGIERLKASDEPMRVVHGDLHRWNVKLYRGQVAAFDFEEMLLGWPVQDIGITLHYCYGEESFPAIRAAFQRGHTSVVPWPERYPGEVDTFIAARNMVLANTVLQSPIPEERAEATRYLEIAERRIRALFAGEPFHLRYW